MHYRVFWLAKRGHRDEEWEDAFAANPDRGRFAVADGASESVFAGPWAQLLVERFVADWQGGPDGWTHWLPRIQEDWSLRFRDRPLPWYAEAKLQQGAFATLLGVVLDASAKPPVPWRVVAVGDSCLFHTRGDELLCAFPLGQSQQFGNSPPLLGSRTSVEEVVHKRAEKTEGWGQPNDRLWLMTDALAQWCLAEHEARQAPWATLDRLLAPAATDAEFRVWIDGLRDAKHLHNDDVTLLGVSF